MQKQNERTIIPHNNFYRQPTKQTQVVRMKDFEAWILHNGNNRFIALGNIYEMKHRTIAGSVIELSAVKWKAGGGER